MNSVNSQIIVCECRGERQKIIEKSGLGKILDSKKISYRTADDLCAMAAHAELEFQNLMNSAERSLVLACSQRSVKLLFHFAGLLHNDTEIPVETISRFESGEDEILSKIETFLSKSEHLKNAPEQKSFHELSDKWRSWYPLIDYSRCTSCRQCEQFCLFGVYSFNDGMVKVVNPEGCKDLCPACARICPQTAIVFPKYAGGGAIGGSDLIDEGVERERIDRDLKEIAGGDIYAALEARKKKRDGLIKQRVFEKAVRERNKALAKANSEGDY